MLIEVTIISMTDVHILILSVVQLEGRYLNNGALLDVMTSYYSLTDDRTFL